MKRKDRYKLLSFVRKQYSDLFEEDYQYVRLSTKELLELLESYDHSSMYEFSYCCYGLYQNCWQDPIEEGVWGLSQAKVNEAIKNTIIETRKMRRKDSRVLYCKSEKYVDVIIVARDIEKMDYLIRFINEKDVRR